MNYIATAVVLVVPIAGGVPVIAISIPIRIIVSVVVIVVIRVAESEAAAPEVAIMESTTTKFTESTTTKFTGSTTTKFTATKTTTESASHLATTESAEAATMEAATAKAATMETATAHAASVETATATATAHATATVATAAATATATATASQRYRWRSQANRRNCQQRYHRLTQHHHSPSEYRSQPRHLSQVAIAPEKRYWLRHHCYSTPRERRLIKFQFRKRTAPIARFRRFHCCRCNLILEFRNKKLLPGCATDVTSISRSSVLPPEYLQALSNEHVQAVIVLVDGMFFQERKRIAQLAASASLLWLSRIVAGGLISYGVYLADSFRRAATYVLKILKGAKPGDLAVEFPNKLELIINLKTSKALGGRPFADTARADRRGDRIEMPFAAAHESVVGTFETCRRTLRMSVYRGRPEVIGARSERRVWSQTGRMIQTRDLGSGVRISWGAPIYPRARHRDQQVSFIRNRFRKAEFTRPRCQSSGVSPAVPPHSIGTNRG
jgi:hypothetical protein